MGEKGVQRGVELALARVKGGTGWGVTVSNSMSDVVEGVFVG